MPYNVCSACNCASSRVYYAIVGAGEDIFLSMDVKSEVSRRLAVDSMVSSSLCSVGCYKTNRSRMAMLRNCGSSFGSRFLLKKTLGRNTTHFCAHPAAVVAENGEENEKKSGKLSYYYWIPVLQINSYHHRITRCLSLVSACRVQQHRRYDCLLLRLLLLL